MVYTWKCKLLTWEKYDVAVEDTERHLMIAAARMIVSILNSIPKKKPRSARGVVRFVIFSFTMNDMICLV